MKTIALLALLLIGSSSAQAEYTLAAEFPSFKQNKSIAIAVPDIFGGMYLPAVSVALAGTSTAIAVIPTHYSDCSTVPVPGAVWLLGSALAGLLSFNRKRS